MFVESRENTVMANKKQLPIGVGSMSKLEVEVAEELADKLRECLELVSPSLEVGSMKMRDAVDLVAADPEAFSRALLKYLGTDSVEEIIGTISQIWNDEGSHK